MKVIIDYESKTVSDYKQIYVCTGYSDTLGWCETIDSHCNFVNGLRISDELEKLVHETYEKIFINKNSKRC